MTRHANTADEYHPRTSFIHAREEARRRGDRRVGTEHLVLALLRDSNLAQALGCDLQFARETLDAMDRDALLDALGVDRAAVSERLGQPPAT